jgi:hypothetical protein
MRDADAGFGVSRRARSRALLAAACLLPCSFAGLAAAQGVVSRSPNLTDGWVEATGTLQFNFNHRFWLLDTPQGHSVQNTPSFLLAAPLPGPLLLGGQYASNSQQAGQPSEWEVFVRWAPGAALGPLTWALTGAYNGAAESTDGELAVRLPIALPEGSPVDSIGLLGAGRIFADVYDEGVPGWFAGGGVVLHFGEGFSISGDAGQATVDSEAATEVWGAALQFRIPVSPHTLSLIATNARTGTLQGSSLGRRTVWGFEFTIPISLDRYFQ